MAQTSTYKGQLTRQRVMTTESSFSKGMKHINQPLDEGFVKTLVNYDIKNDGDTIKPRGGIEPYTGTVAEIPGNWGTNTVHNSGTLYVQLPDETDAFLCNYAIFGQCTIHSRFRVEYSTLIVYYKGEYYTAQYDSTIDDAIDVYYYLTMTPAIDQIHGMEVKTPYMTSNGVYGSIDANTYVLVYNPKENEAERHFMARVYAWFTLDDKGNISGVKWCLKRVIPKNVAATQVVNYGYNMLSDEPYTFNDDTTAVGALVLQGILPYKKDGTLLLTARPGTEITFRLYYQYPQGLADTERYLVQWEFQNLDADTDPVVVQPLRKSPEIIPGKPMTFTTAPTFKSFSVIAKVYLKSEVPVKDNVLDYDNARVDQVLTLSSYYLTTDSTSTTLNVEPKVFDLGTAAGMCSWQQRLVVWGVDGAKSSIFVSDINSPDYFPYPNGTEIFTSDVIGCVPYMGALLIFTKNALYKATLATDGLSYNVKCVQERLNMQESDINTIQIVQNMVYFKSNEYFYMIVPNPTSLTGELQMAPVSRPIENMLQNFEESVHGILNDVYNIDYLPYNDKITLELVDFFVYLDSNHICNSYKLKISMYARNGALRGTKYLDFQLNYDTVLREWSIYINESTQNRDAVFMPTVTGRAIFYHIYAVDDKTNIMFTRFSETCPKDNIPLTDNMERTFGNNQYIETGYRKHSEEIKKRYREIDFCINCLGKEKLKFYTGFVLDDDVRKSYYKHKSTHCTDKEDASYGMLFIERVLDDSVDGESLTLLDTGWELDTSQFPDLTVTKIRYKVSGKGYNASVKILSTNETDYEILDISWIYRMMFAR